MSNSISARSGRIGQFKLALAALLLCMTLIATGQNARAASFDCKKATTSREQAICADTRLSDFDSQVSQLYKRALGQLSPAGAERLRRDERAWLTLSNWEYCHGTPHGHGGSQVQNMVLKPKLRPFEARDLFRSGKGGEERLTALLLAAVEQDARADDPDLSKLNRDAVADAARSPNRWSLRETGLGVAFDPYELGEGYPFAPDVTVPWSALRDVLVGDPTRP